MQEGFELDTRPRAWFDDGLMGAGKTSLQPQQEKEMAKQDIGLIGLAVMAELPIVIVVVQRGSPSTGLPTRVELNTMRPSGSGAGSKS